MELALGIILGLSTLLFVGPVFFYLLKSAIEHSAKAGIMAALGIIAGDAIYASLLYKGFLPLLQAPEHQQWVAFAGGIILLSLGILYLTTSGKRKQTEQSQITTPWFQFFANGFILNFVNPFVVAVWIGFFSIIQSNSNTNTEIIITLSTILVVIFTTDCLKVFFASKIKHFFTPLRLRRMRQLLGVVMVIFSIRLFMSAFS